MAYTLVYVKNWVGNYVSVNSRTGAWNTHAIATISQQLQQELPGLKGFSETGIKDMRIFYETWSPYLNWQPSVADLKNIGIILCRSMNEKKVEFSFRDMTKPMGVATYHSSSELPEAYKNILPSAEELRKLL